MNERHGYAKLEGESLRRLFRNPFIVLFSHWVFQGMLYMDPSERGFKIGLDLISTFLFGSILTIYIPLLPALIIAFVLSHTMNFLFNGHLWSLLRFFDFTSHDFLSFDQYRRVLVKRIHSANSLKFAAIYGSYVRKNWDPHSDLDIRLVRSPGFMNCIRACTFVYKERARAFINAFPLDIYVFDDMKSLKRMKDDENPLVIKSVNDQCGLKQ